MFGWTVEALNMLVLPMIRDQYVHCLYCGGMGWGGVGSGSHDGCLEEDRHLPMFGWTVEALNMLVLPMIRDQYVDCLYCGRGGGWVVGHLGLS